MFFMKKLLSKKRVASLLSTVALLWAGPCFSADPTSSPWQITADKIIRYGKPENVVAEGNVVMVRDQGDSPNPVTIKADWIRYNVTDGVIHARGNLTMRNTNEDVDAEEALIDLNKETATLTDTTLFVPENNLHFVGKEVEKTDPITYHFTDGEFTTCNVKEGKTPPWQFRSADTVVKVEKVTTLKHTVLRVKGVPVLYLPYIVLPGNTKRRTGLLLPEFSQSKLSGTGLITPFFIDLSPSSDITLYPGYLSKRGLVAGAEFRYVADSNSRMTVAGTYIHDKTKDTVEDDYKDDGYLRDQHHRYWIRGKLDHELGKDFFLRADLDMASDRDYLQEFEKYANGFDESDKAFLKDYNRGLAEQTLPYRPSQVQLSKTWSSSFLGGQMIGVDDLVDDSDAESQVNTLPRILYNGVFELKQVPVSLSWNSEYVNYWREEGVGQQRLNAHPRLTAPLPFGRLVEGTISSGLQETIYRVKSYGSSKYDWQYDENQERTAWDVNANIATTMARDFDMDIGSVSWMNHSIRPELSYTYVSVDSQDQLPSIDAVDRISLTNLVSYSLDNYFRLGGIDDGNPYNRYIGYLKLNQTFNVHEERRDLSGPDDKRRPFSDISLDLNIYPLPRWQTKYKTTYSVYGQGFTSYDFFTKFTAENGDSLAMDYRYNKGSEVNQLNAEIKTRLSETLYLEGDIKQSLHTDEITSASLGLVYHPQCWAMKVFAEKNTDDKRFVIMFSMVGLGETLGVGMSEDMAGGHELVSGGDGLDLD